MRWLLAVMVLAACGGPESTSTQTDAIGGLGPAGEMLCAGANDLDTWDETHADGLHHYSSCTWNCVASYAYPEPGSVARSNVMVIWVYERTGPTTWRVAGYGAIELPPAQAAAYCSA